MPYSNKNNKVKKIYDQNHPTNKDKKMYDQESSSYKKRQNKNNSDDDLIFIKNTKDKNLKKRNTDKNVNNFSSKKVISTKPIKYQNTTHSKNIEKISNKKEFTKKKIIVKKKLKIKSIIISILIILIFSLIPIYIWAINKNSNSDNNLINNNDSNTSDTNSSNVNDDNSTNKKDEWDIAEEKLDFYKKEFKERYINYKKKNPNLNLETVVIYVNIGLDYEFYKNIIDSPQKNTNLVLVNKYHTLGSDYVPADLETINSKYSSGVKQLSSDARIAFEKLAKEASLNGYTIKAVSTYRSYSYQKKLYSNYVSNDGVKNADTYSARAGHSEHQTGLAVDVSNMKVSYTNFGTTKEFKWMKENAHKYGFILRYTKNNEFITGYKDEPWHYRYVGVDVATYIYENPMTYEEYYVRFLDK